MKKFVLALLASIVVFAAGCADQSAQPLPQDQSSYQSGHSSKLGN